MNGDEAVQYSFKPCYKWITFNTPFTEKLDESTTYEVLNLVINGLPSILWVN